MKYKKEAKIQPQKLDFARKISPQQSVDTVSSSLDNTTAAKIHPTSNSEIHCYRVPVNQIILDRRSGIVGVGKRYGEFSYNGLPLDSEVVGTVGKSGISARRDHRGITTSAYVRRAGKKGIPS